MRGVRMIYPPALLEIVKVPESKKENPDKKKAYQLLRSHLIPKK